MFNIFSSIRLSKVFFCFVANIALICLFFQCNLSNQELLSSNFKDLAVAISRRLNTTAAAAAIGEPELRQLQANSNDVCRSGADQCDSVTSTCVYSQSDRSYTCRCLKGFERDPSDRSGKYVCRDIKECQANPNPCQTQLNKEIKLQTQPYSIAERSNCIELPGSYECVCAKGFKHKAKERTAADQSGLDKTQCESKRFCNTAEDLCDKSRSTCVDERGDYRCDCKAGYERLVEDAKPNLKKCVDVKECNGDLNPCQLQLNDEKRRREWPHSIAERSNCIELPGSYECVCAKGFQHKAKERTAADQSGLDKTQCESKRFCNTAEDLCDKSRSTCVDERGDYRCDCKAGYERLVEDAKPNLKKCVDIDECTVGVQKDASNLPCDLTSSVCVNTVGAYRCECFLGYETVGQFSASRHCRGCCVDIDECARKLHKCQEVCVDGFVKPQNYTCGCREGRYVDGYNCYKCEFTDWGPYDDCSVKCGRGVQTRYRSPRAGFAIPQCTTPEQLQSTISCDLGECETKECQVTEWSDWTVCKEGKKTRSRVILKSGVDACSNIELEEVSGCIAVVEETSTTSPVNWLHVGLAIAVTVVGIVAIIALICTCMHKRKVVQDLGNVDHSWQY